MFKYTLNLQGLSLYFDKTEKIDTNKDLKENNMSQKTMKTMDGNTAAAHVSYAFTEVAAIYQMCIRDRSTAGVRLDGMKLVLDCANGAASAIAEDVFAALGADVTVICNEPDGININDGCGSTHTEKLCRKVIEEKADIGLAFDGDADRLIAVDETGTPVDGDRVISICAKLLQEEGTLKNDTVTVTVMSNLGFHKRAEELGMKVDITAVGDRYVLELSLIHI